jgi:hygromycin-B 7''-O-kinase
VEGRVLRHLEGLPSPDLVACGKVEGWPYLVLSVVPGVPAVDVWHSLSREDRIMVVSQVGHLMVRLHAHPPLDELGIDWNRFLEERIAGALEHHAPPAGWRDWLQRRVHGFTEGPFRPVLLHADITHDHVLLERKENAWVVTGIIDFGDAMMGHPHYDLVAPLICFAAGDAAVARSLVGSCGGKLDRDLSERLLTYCLLHRYAKLSDITARIGVDHPDGIFEAFWGGPEGSGP